MYVGGVNTCPLISNVVYTAKVDSACRLTDTLLIMSLITNYSSRSVPAAVSLSGSNMERALVQGVYTALRAYLITIRVDSLGQ